MGDIQYNSDYGRLDAPELQPKQGAEGEAVVLSCSNTEYLEKITAVYLNGDWKELASDKYTVDAAAGTLTIDASVLSAGEVKLVVDASGYKSQAVTVDYQKVLETGLKLFPDYPENEEAFTADENGYAEASFIVGNSEGDFLKNLKTVVLTDENQEADNVLAKGAEGSDAVYYVVSEDKKSITLCNVRPGSYTVSITAEYYEDELEAEFAVKDGQPAEEQKEAPQVGKVTYNAGFMSFTPEHYRVTFEGLVRADLEAYLKAITDVEVNGTSYRRPLLGLNSYDGPQYYQNVTDGTGQYDCLDLTLDGFSTDENTEVTILADGYDDVIFTVDKDGQLVTGETIEVKPAPKLKGETTISAGEKVILTCDDEEYLEAVSKIYYDADEELSYHVSGSELSIDVSGLESGSMVTLTVEADGYEDNTVDIDVEEEAEEGNKAPTVEEFKKKVPSSLLDTECYRVTFGGLSGDVLTGYLNKITSVRVGSIDYKRTSSFWNSVSEYKLSAADSMYDAYAYDCLDLTTDGFAGEEEIEVVISADGYEDIAFTVKDGKLIKTEESSALRAALNITALKSSILEAVKAETNLTAKEDTAEAVQPEGADSEKTEEPEEKEPDAGETPDENDSAEGEKPEESGSVQEEKPGESGPAQGEGPGESGPAEGEDPEETEPAKGENPEETPEEGEPEEDGSLDEDGSSGDGNSEDGGASGESTEEAAPSDANDQSGESAEVL